MDVKEISAEVFGRNMSTTGDRLLLHPKDRDQRPMLWAVQENQRGIMAELRRMVMAVCDQYLDL